METKKKGLGFKISILITGIVPMLITVIVMCFFLKSTLENNIRDGIRNELEAAAIGVREYFAYDVIANGEVDYEEYSDHQYMESMQVVGVELTLFQDDTRLLTSLKNTDGSYNEGTQAASEIYASVKSGNEYYSEGVVINGTEYSVYYIPVYDGDNNFWGMAFAGEPEAEIQSTISGSIRQVIVLAVILVVIFGAAIILIWNYFSKALTKIVTGLDTLAGGDLSAHFRINCLIREFTEMGNAADTLSDRLSEVIGEVKGTASTLGDSVMKVDSSIDSMVAGADQISQIVNDLAGAAQSMAETVQEANVSIAEMDENITSIADSANVSHEDAERMEEINSETSKVMEKVSVANVHSVESIGNIAKLTHECNEFVEKIKQAAEVIANIASRTNLLALNASIEAARAGESGRGFAVVAESIKDLAEQSKKSADEISGFVQDIVNKVTECVEASEGATAIMQDQSELVADASERMKSLKESVDTVAEAINRISDAAEALNRSKDSVVGHITELSTISEENAASAQQAAANVTSISSAASDTKTESEEMGGLSRELLERVAYFSDEQ